MITLVAIHGKNVKQMVLHDLFTFLGGFRQSIAIILGYVHAKETSWFSLQVISRSADFIAGPRRHPPNGAMYII